jgi:hypothetical protein
MSIAQRSVAGEADDHPSSTQQNVDSEDKGALAEFSSDTTNLPWIVFRAAFRASHVDGLSTRARAVLAALARTVDAKRPYASVYARRDLLTDRSMQSTRTFYRSLADLEAAGLIHRPPQSRYVEAGLFGRAYLHLTEKAAILLGFVENTPANTPEQATSNESAPASDSLPSLHDHPPANVAHGAIYEDLSPSSFQERQPGQLPADLQRLLSLGFRRFLIFRLMREAREQGKFLSDVVDATWQHLARAHAPINYLRALIQGPTDFAYQVRAKREVEHRQTQMQSEAKAVRTAIDRCAGKVFFDQEQRRIALSDDGLIMTVHDPREANPRVAGGAWQGAFVKALHAGLIRDASDHEKNAFAQRMTERLRKVTAPAEEDDKTPPAAQIAAREAQKKLKEILRGSKMSLPFSHLAGH